MAYENQPDTWQGKDCGCTDTESTVLKKAIGKLKDEYCNELFKLKGDVTTLEIRKGSLDKIITDRQRWFVWTERNYRLHRNLGFQTAAELSQTSDSIKEGVKVYVNTNKALADALLKLMQSVKELKTKASELREAGRKLSDCKKDQCNCSQVIELTGEVPEGCKGEPPGERQKPCDPATVKAILNKLIHMPEHLYTDLGSIHNASADVSGIQKFSNITTLEPLQQVLTERIKSFDTYLKDVIKRGEADVKTSLDDLIKSKKEVAKTEVELYASRSDFEGVKKAVAFYCCQPCTCIPKDKDDCDKRLDGCEKEICEICGKVKDADCVTAPPPVK